MKNITKVGVATLVTAALVAGGSAAANAATHNPGDAISTVHGYSAVFPVGAQAPAGMTVDPSTGVVSGTPVADGSFYVWSGSSLAAADKVYGLSTSAQVSGSSSTKFAALTPSATDLGATGQNALYAFVATPEGIGSGTNGWAAYTYVGDAAANTAAVNIGMGNLGVSGSNNGGVAALFSGTGTKTAYVGVSLTKASGVVPVVTWARQITINADTDTYTFAADQIIIDAPPQAPLFSAVSAKAAASAASHSPGTTNFTNVLPGTYTALIYNEGNDIPVQVPTQAVVAASGDVTVDLTGVSGLPYNTDLWVAFVQPGDIEAMEDAVKFQLTSQTAFTTPLEVNIQATGRFELTGPSTGVDFGDVLRDTTATAALGGFTVIDDRNTLTGWSVNVSANDFTGPSGATISKDQLGYVATVVGGNSAGSAPTTGKTAGAGAFGSALAATTGNGTAASGANYDLNLSFLAPVSATAGSYTSSVTLTLVPAS